MDCLEGLSKLKANSVDLIVTDPPFKVSQRYGGGVDSDNLINVASIMQTIPEMCRVLKEGRLFVCFYDNRILPLLFQAIRGTELVYKKSIYLYRRWGNANRWMGWMQCTDPVCFFVKGNNKPFYQGKIKGKVKHDCYTKAHPEKDNTGHPAQKPLEIIKDIITWCSAEGDVVLDPYGGSGSVAVACKELKRYYLIYENNKEYVDIINKRLTAGGNTLLRNPATQESLIIANSNKIKDFTSDSSKDGRTFAKAKES